jgi:hypothetical protein
MLDRVTTAARPQTLRDTHARAASVSLHDGVPDDIRSHFAMAQNLLVYSWFNYPFNVAAELHGYLTVDYALRVRSLEPDKANFSARLNRAVAEGILTGDGFTYGRASESVAYPPEVEVQPPAEEVKDYVRDVAAAMRMLRNSLAHGSNTLRPKGYRALLVCSEIVNQLFPRPPSPVR